MEKGISMCGKEMSQGLELIRLWSHEMMRVFHDRLIDDLDRQWFCDTLKQTLKSNIKLTDNTIFNVN